MLQVSDLHQHANTRLGEVSGNPKKLVLIHTTIAIGASLLLPVITYLFDLLVADTGGLGGIRTRAMLTTGYCVLALALLLANPFWQKGIFYAALQWTKGEEATFSSLLQGFRRFGAVLKLLFLQGGLFFLLGVAAFNISNIIFTLTPFSDSYLELFKPFMEQGVTVEQLQAQMTSEFAESVVRAALPLFVIFAILYAFACITLFYRVRFAKFAVMDGLSASRSILKSFAITRKKFWRLFRLDLSFWWFYLLQILAAAVCLTGLWGAALGIVCQCVLLWQYEAKRLTVYGLAYRALDNTVGPGEAAPQC